MNNAALSAFFRKAAHDVYEWLVVSKCPSCGALTRHSGVLCEDCLSKYEKEKELECKYCKMPASVCVCSARDLSFCREFEKSLYSYAFYSPENSVLSASLYMLKRSPDRNAEKMFARELSAELLRLAAKSGVDLSAWSVTFSPRGVSSVLNYGFDQSKGLAKRISKLTGAEFEDVFSRRGSAKQKTLDAKERKESAENAFSLKKNAHVSGKKYIIVDDVVTTGATMRACEELLLKAGAESVFALSIAKTPRTGKGYDREDKKRRGKKKKEELWFN